MENLRQFVNNYVTEDGEQFSRNEFRKAVTVSVLVCVVLALCCMA